MDISIVLASWNNHAMLRNTLEHVLACEVPKATSVEYVIVDNNSKDATRDTVQAIIDAHPRHTIRYVFEGIQGLAQARQTGLAHAQGQLIIFTDDDVEPAPNWISEYWTAAREQGDACFFGGPVESIYEAPLSPDLIEFAPHSVKGLTLGPVSKLVDSKRLTFLAANWAARSDIVLAVGGFDTRLGLNSTTGPTVGEETRLMERLVEQGLQPYYIAGAKLLHHVPRSKTEVRHIAERAQAYHYYRTVRRGGVLRSRRLTVAGAPWWLFVGLARDYAGYLLRRLTRRPWKAAYMAYRGRLGTLQAVRLLHRESRGNADGHSGLQH